MRFLKARGGNVALYFSLALIPIISVIGFATDASRQDAVQSELQNAVDMTALATTRTLSDQAMSEEERKAFAKSFFVENFSRGEFVTLNEPMITFPESGSVRIEVTGTMSTVFMGLVGIPEMEIGASSRTKAGGPSVLEAALVLDVSHSMNGQPLDDLKTAAKGFVAQVLDATNSDIRISIVPFSHYVNVGTGNRNASWINVPADYTKSWESCYSEEHHYIDAGCVHEDYECTYEEYDTGETVTDICSRWNCPDPDAVGADCTTDTYDFSWYGCVGSRPPPQNVTDDRWDIDVEGVMAMDGAWCPPPIQPLTKDKATLDAAIDGLTATDETYIAPGIAWGVRTLSPGVPFDEALDDTTFTTKGGKRVLVLMSDGANTRSRNTAGWPEGNDKDAANATTLAACDEAKAQGIEVYSIAYRLTDAATLQLLKDCASDPAHAFSADNAADLMAQFDNIGSSLSELRLAQ